MGIKRIPIDSVSVGMYLCGIDQSWLNTPFLLHRFLIKRQVDIDKLKNCGILAIDIDTDRGIDVPALQVPETSGDDQAEQAVPTLLAPSEEERINHLSKELQGISLSQELSSIRQTRKQLLDGVHELLEALAKTGRVEVEKVNECSQAIIEETLNHEEAYIALIQTREFSPILYDHALTVSTLAVLLGRAAGLEDIDLQYLGTAGLLHDVGLLYLPNQLHRPVKKLSTSELTIYQTHSQRGVDALKKNPNLAPKVLELILQHHEALDGSGYPAKFSSDTLDRSSRILRIVDEYDELLSGHHSGNPLSVRAALQLLYQKGKKGMIDPVLVARFINVIGIYPTYSLVELNTGERGIVTGNSRDNLLEPMILLIQDANHQPLLEPIPLNFSVLSPQTTKPQIVGVLSPEEAGITVESVLKEWVTL
ncbi:MAG: HD-GYP domain-containing protein [Nitrospirales bacterium]